MNRRDFLSQLGAYAALGTTSGLALPLTLMGASAAEAATDYKAIVCIYLLGGNDQDNTFVPYDSARYAAYQSLRSNIALTQSSVAANVLSPAHAVTGNAQSASPQIAMAPGLEPLVPLFNTSRKLSIIQNIGTLITPTSKAQYTAASVPLPPQLFSHLDQTKFSQSLTTTKLTGWGGRLEDLLYAANSVPAFSAISLAGNALYMTGNATLQYQVSTSGAVPINGLNRSLFGSSAVGAALNAVVNGGAGSSNLFEGQLSAVASRSITAQSLLSSAIGTTSPFANLFPAGYSNALANQLQMVARIINARQALGVSRQVFFVTLAPFDTHDAIALWHPRLMTQLGEAMAAFQASVDQMGMGPNVISFTSSDFGRTLTSNSDGSDHGWGSHHFLMGDAIQGGQILGKVPVLADGGIDDVGQGRLLPTTSWDQLAAALGSWMGASASSLNTALPNLGNFSTTAPVFI